MTSYQWINTPPVFQLSQNEIESAIISFEMSLGRCLGLLGGTRQDKNDPLKVQANNAGLVLGNIGDPTSLVWYGYRIDGVWAGLIACKPKGKHLYVEALVAHPGFMNAGSILIEYVTRFTDIIELRAAEHVREFYEKIGFLPLGEDGQRYLLWLPYSRLWYKAIHGYRLIKSAGCRYLTNCDPEKYATTYDPEMLNVFYG